MNIQDAYTRWSDTYDSDRNLTRDLDHRATRDALTGLRYQNIMELGCGTGKNTAFLTAIGQRILALDFSPGMLRHAKAKINSDAVFFVVADLTKPWPCKDKTFELIVCNFMKDGNKIELRILCIGQIYIVLNERHHPRKTHQGLRISALFQDLNE